MEEQNNKNLEKIVMEKIKTGKVRLKSKYIFLAEKLGFKSILIFSFMLSILFLSLLLFYFKSTDNLFYLSFGSRGLFAFLESFPFFLMIYFIALIFLTGLLLSRTELAYKKSFTYISAIFLLFIFSFASLFAFSSMNKQIDHHFFSQKSFLPNKIRPMIINSDFTRENSLVGMVLYYEYPEVIIQSAVFEEEVIVDLSKIKVINLNNGDFVVFLGNKTGEREFVAKDFKIVPEGGLKMIKNRLEENIDCACQNNNLTKCKMINQENFKNDFKEECFRYCIMSDWESKTKCENCLNSR
jgi:hypothetical protein